MRIRNRRVAISLLIAMVIGTTMNPFPVSEAQTVAWQQMTDSQRREAIVSRAFQDLGRDVGLQCKPWVRDVIRNSGGPAIPRTFEAQYDPYNLARWSDDYTVTPIWRARYDNTFIIDFVAYGLKRGHVVQWRPHVGLEHTFIITAVATSYIDVIHSNYTTKNTVTQKRFYANDRLNNIAAWTVYRIN